MMALLIRISLLAGRYFVAWVVLVSLVGTQKEKQLSGLGPGELYSYRDFFSSHKGFIFH